jgi:hypothetical protein
VKLISHYLDKMLHYDMVSGVRCTPQTGTWFSLRETSSTKRRPNYGHARHSHREVTVQALCRDSCAGIEGHAMGSKCVDNSVDLSTNLCAQDLISKHFHCLHSARNKKPCQMPRPISTTSSPLPRVSVKPTTLRCSPHSWPGFCATLFRHALVFSRR